MRRLLASPCRAAAAGLRRLAADERGNVIIYVSLTAALLLGMTGLALDGSRAMITHSEAQAAADAAALAGASQLDAQSGACANAKAEATAVTNQQRFAQGGAAPVTIASGSPICLSGLPTSDSASTSGLATTDDVASAYIQVTTQQLTHQNTLLNAVSPTNQTALIQRTAVAGFRRSLCAAAPVMMVCSTDTWTTGVAYDAWVNNAANKGFVCPGCNSANDVRDALANSTPAFCVNDNADPAPGNKTGKAPDGMNTRFGIGSSASQPSDTDVMDFTAYSKDISGGTGWDCAGYWSANHATDGLAKPAGCTANATTVTRYSVYQSERAGHIPPAGVTPASAAATATGERRLLYLAIINNCPTTTPGTPLGYVRAFVLGPMTGKNFQSVYIEPLGIATSKTDPTAIHEEVQLYR